MTGMVCKGMKQLGLGALCLLAMACDFEDPSAAHTANLDAYDNHADNEASGQVNALSYREIYARLIRDERFPADFYVEPQNDSDFFIRIQHLSNHDLADFTVSFRYPLCASNHSNAFDKANRTAVAKNASLQSSDLQHDYYYEFSWLSASNLLNIQRIYRCETFRVDTDNTYQRTYQVAVFDTKAFQRFIEYQWYFSFNNNYGNVVIESAVEQTEDGLTAVKITSAHLTSLADCDEISMRENYFSIDPVTREITQSVNNYEVFYMPSDAADFLC